MQGQVDPGLYQPSALSAEEMAQGKVLLCAASALNDVEIEYAVSSSEKRFREYSARVVKLEKLTYDVMLVPVSYTHLDVYKRQGGNSCTQCHPGSCTECFHRCP